MAMKLTVGVMGASGGTLTEEVRRRAYRLGEALAARDLILITGGCPGLPYEAVQGAKAKGGFVVGISPGLSLDEHQGKYRSPVAAQCGIQLGGIDLGGLSAKLTKQRVKGHHAA